ncbi:titin-like [Anopheles ziemanni]|uniref:titin-like n=1 Tax=Anopheles coustani TaxID=139045 RepID=UPI00265B33BD|nr:titin-like [Anopheles coustani]XP_058169663.1 titin-like [Anopheles ziemanni]
MPISAPKIPDGLPELMRGLAKSVIKENPENLYVHAAEYFENLIRERDGELERGYQTFNAYQVYADYKEKSREKLGLGGKTGEGSSISDGEEGDESGSGGSGTKSRGRRRARRARKQSSREKDNPVPTVAEKPPISEAGEVQKLNSLSEESAPVSVVEQEVVKVHYNPPEAAPSARVVSAQSVEAAQAVSNVLDDEQILDSDSGTGGKETGDEELVEGNGDDVGTAPSTAEITEPGGPLVEENGAMALQDMETCFMHANVDDLLEKHSEDPTAGDDDSKGATDVGNVPTGEDIPEGPQAAVDSNVTLNAPESVKQDVFEVDEQAPTKEIVAEVEKSKTESDNVAPLDENTTAKEEVDVGEIMPERTDPTAVKVERSKSSDSEANILTDNVDDGCTKAGDETKEVPQPDEKADQIAATQSEQAVSKVVTGEPESETKLPTKDASLEKSNDEKTQIESPTKDESDKETDAKSDIEQDDKKTEEIVSEVEPQPVVKQISLVSRVALDDDEAEEEAENKIEPQTTEGNNIDEVDKGNDENNKKLSDENTVESNGDNIQIVDEVKEEKGMVEQTPSNDKLIPSDSVDPQTASSDEGKKAVEESLTKMNDQPTEDSATSQKTEENEGEEQAVAEVNASYDASSSAIESDKQIVQDVTNDMLEPVVESKENVSDKPITEVDDSKGVESKTSEDPDPQPNLFQETADSVSDKPITEVDDSKGAESKTLKDLDHQPNLSQEKVNPIEGHDSEEISASKEDSGDVSDLSATEIGAQAPEKVNTELASANGDDSNPSSDGKDDQPEAHSVDQGEQHSLEKESMPLTDNKDAEEHPHDTESSDKPSEKVEPTAASLQISSDEKALEVEKQAEPQASEKSPENAESVAAVSDSVEKGKDSEESTEDMPDVMKSDEEKDLKAPEEPLTLESVVMDNMPQFLAGGTGDEGNNGEENVGEKSLSSSKESTDKDNGVEVLPKGSTTESNPEEGGTPAEVEASQQQDVADTASSEALAEVEPSVKKSDDAPVGTTEEPMTPSTSKVESDSKEVIDKSDDVSEGSKEEAVKESAAEQSGDLKEIVGKSADTPIGSTEETAKGSVAEQESDLKEVIEEPCVKREKREASMEEVIEEPCVKREVTPTKTTRPDNDDAGGGKQVEELEEIKKVDLSQLSKDSAEALFYSLKKSELENQEPDGSPEAAAPGAGSQESNADEDDKDVVVAEEPPEMVTEEATTKRTFTDDFLDEAPITETQPADAGGSSDGVQQDRMEPQALTARSSSEAAEQEDEFNPMVMVSMRSKQFQEQLHSRVADGEPGDEEPTEKEPTTTRPLMRRCMTEMTGLQRYDTLADDDPVDPRRYDPDYVEEEDQFDGYYIGHIKNKILASSVSVADSDYFDPTQSSEEPVDENNVRTALETIASTDTESTIASQATIQQATAGKRSYLRKHSQNTSSNIPYASFGNAAIDKSLDEFIEREEQNKQDEAMAEAATKIQRSYRTHKKRLLRDYHSTMRTFTEDLSAESGEEYPSNVIQIKLDQKRLGSGRALPSIGDGGEESDSTPVNQQQPPHHQPLGTVKRPMYSLNIDDYDTVARRMTLTRGVALQRNSTPEDDSGKSTNASTDRKPSSLNSVPTPESAPASSGSGEGQLARTSSEEKSDPLKTEEPTAGSSGEQDHKEGHSSSRSRPQRTAPAATGRDPEHGPLPKNRTAIAPLDVQSLLLIARQRTMPVQMDSSVIRVLPKHMRKRISSAGMPNGGGKRKL